MTAPLPLFASCAPGLEAMLAAELADLGALDPRAVPGGVRFSGHRAVVYRASLESGLASHVLARVGSFHAARFDRLAGALERLPWEGFLTPGVPRAFRVTAKKSRLHHTEAVAERAARAIARRLGDTCADPSRRGVPVLLRLERDRVQASVDTSGEPLHRRGYRTHTSKAPLREDLARALILASGWDPATPFVDPFCGSGTLPIEAAYLARRLAPGRRRGFAFERMALFHAATWRRVREQAEARELARAPAPILGGDRDAGVLSAAAHNAERAAVRADVRLEHAPVSELPLEALAAEPAGALVTNPPYGHRLSRDRDLAPLYRALGRRVAALPPGWRLAIACRDRRLARAVAPDLRAALAVLAGGLRIRFEVRGPAG